MDFKIPEGATPLDDLSDLLLDGVFTYSDLCAAEAENILQAMEIHLGHHKNPRRIWFTEAYLRRVHRDMFGKVWKWAGKYRATQKNVGIPAGAISEEVAKLADDVAHWNKSEMPVLERAVRLHHRLAWIHPFSNGNGRHARLMSDIYLYSHRYSLPIWPESTLSETGNPRSVYLSALHDADRGNFEPLAQFTQSLLPKDSKKE